MGPVSSPRLIAWHPATSQHDLPGVAGGQVSGVNPRLTRQSHAPCASHLEDTIGCQ